MCMVYDLEYDRHPECLFYVDFVGIYGFVFDSDVCMATLAAIVTIQSAKPAAIRRDKRHLL